MEVLMPLQATSGAASYDAFGGGAAAVPNYIEDVFSTWLYTGTGANQTITNGIDLAGKGGLTWIKARSTTGNHRLFDTVRGVNRPIYSNLTNAQATESNTLTAFNANGFTLGPDAGVNQASQTWASWTFREQAKFFDCVTYTGTGSARTVAHSLGSVPGCIIVKKTSGVDDWSVYHRSIGSTKFLSLNTTAAETTNSTRWNNTDPTATEFTVGTSASTNQSGQTYVAYIYAHNAGGFGLTGTDNVISCGGFTTDGSGLATINLGYEPQWILYKNSTGTGSWFVVDNMRGLVTGGNDAYLQPNSSGAENTGFNLVDLNSTGFSFQSGAFGSTTTGIYIAIRRGPMKVPTTGTSVYAAAFGTGSSNPAWISGFPVDMEIDSNIGGGSTDDRENSARLIQGTYLRTNLTNAAANFDAEKFDYMNGWRTTNNGSTDFSWMFRRAPGFMDVCCYTGTGANADISHNLGVVPELIIVKRRDTAGTWNVYSAGTGNGQYLILNSSAVAQAGSLWRSTTPTSSLFYLNDTAAINGSGGTFVAYLFASCPGVSKVGSYTGNGSSQTINCGFTGGARFVLIKRTNATGAWYVWDSARGIVTGNDPYLLLNATDSEVTSNDTIDTDSTGFVVNQVAATNVNVNAATYIFLAIA
jgi:hypothetical protein